MSDFESVSLCKLLDSLEHNEVFTSCNFVFNQTLERSHSIECCDRLLEEAIANIFDYFHKSDSKTKNSLEIDFYIKEESVSLNFKVPNPIETDLTSLNSLVEKDHSPSSLKLIFAREVLNLHGFDCLINRSTNNISFQFPL